MNPDKSEIISFQSKRTKTQELTVGGQTKAEKVKLLGVVVDTGYKFTSMSKTVAPSDQFLLPLIQISIGCMCHCEVFREVDRQFMQTSGNDAF